MFLAFPIAVLAWPLDGPITDLVRSFRLGGDLRRELEMLQQFGGATSIILSAILVWTLAPARRDQLASWIGAFALASLTCVGLKVLIGRPRPKFGDPSVLLGPAGAYPIDAEAGIAHAWEVWKPISSDLWSMPSSHTAFAVVLGVLLTRVDTRLTPLACAMVALVGACRVIFGAHYLSDVLAGAGVGWMCVRAWVGPISPPRALTGAEAACRG